MKPIESSIRHSGNILTENSVRMSFDEESSVHLMGILTDMYSDKPLALIREYSTNALDSHREAGVEKPILVTLPTTLTNTLSIEDFGIGMSAEEILKRYGEYGSSTKRDSNTFNGMLGIGCKSALSYTSQFTVRARKDGVETVALVARDETGAGSISILSEREVDEDNGLRVEIPIPEYDSSLFRQTASDFFRYWDPSLYETNVEVTYFNDDENSLRLTDHVTLYGRTSPRGIGYGHSSSSRGDMDIVVMGDAYYPFNYQTLMMSRGDSSKAKARSINLPISTHSLIIELPNGSIPFAPSREEITYTKASSELITDLLVEASDVFKEKMQEQFDKHDRDVEAIKFLNKWKSVLKDGETFVHRGKTFQTDDGSFRNWFVASAVAGQESYTVHAGWDFVQKACLFITGYKASGVPNHLKDYLKTILPISNVRDRAKRVYFMDTFGVEEFYPSDMVYRWEDLRDGYNAYLKTHTSSASGSSSARRAKPGLWVGHKLKVDEDGNKSYEAATDITLPIEGHGIYLNKMDSSSTPPGLSNTLMNGLLATKHPPEVVFRTSGTRYDTFLKRVMDEENIISLGTYMEEFRKESIEEIDPLLLSTISFPFMQTFLELYSKVDEETRMDYLSKRSDQDNVLVNHLLEVEQSEEGLGDTLMGSSQGSFAHGVLSDLISVTRYSSSKAEIYRRVSIRGASDVSQNQIIDKAIVARSIADTVAQEFPLAATFSVPVAHIFGDYNKLIEQDKVEYLERKFKE